MLSVIVVLASVSTLAIAATVRALRADGYHRIPTDRTRLP